MEAWGRVWSAGSLRCALGVLFTLATTYKVAGRDQRASAVSIAKVSGRTSQLSTETDYRMGAMGAALVHRSFFETSVSHCVSLGAERTIRRPYLNRAGLMFELDNSTEHTILVGALCA